MGELKVWQSGYRTGVNLARSVVGLGKGRHRRAATKRPQVIPPGAHVETFGEAVRWGQPFLDWGKPWRWLCGLKGGQS